MLHIITRCTRLQNLRLIKESIDSLNDIDFNWHIIFDTHRIKDIEADILSTLQSDQIHLHFWKGRSGDWGHDLINQCLDIINGWVYVLDDDNIIHPNLIEKLPQLLKGVSKGYFFHQWIGGKDFTGLDERIAQPENIKVGSIDMGQILVHTDLIANHRLPPHQYVADGLWIEKIYQENPDSFEFIPEICCYYNYLQKPPMPISLPRVLVYGVDEIDINSHQPVEFEDSRLNVLCKKEDNNFEEDLIKFKPNSIITIGDNWDKFKMAWTGLELRRRWLHYGDVVPQIGPSSYNCAMSSILNPENDNEPLVSFITPFFNTGDKIKRTYESIANQTYKNWEWVLVNDSTDNGFTLKICEELAKKDHRIKIYDLREKTGGIIGESKYRGFILSKGQYLMELDHDDELLPTAAELMVKAFQKFPTAGFVYSDAAEVDENHQSLTYGDVFAFGYGQYRDEVYNNKLYKACVAPNINPLTIRHIVGVPNHFRAWKRKTYFEIGGHNRDLTIADDYELIVRTFLHSRMVHIPKLCYIQHYHHSDSLNNTQNSSRGDIQRRVRTIMEFYNEKIKKRFEELGYNDWAYEFNSQWPLSAPKREEESYVNYIYQEELVETIPPFIL